MSENASEFEVPSYSKDIHWTIWVVVSIAQSSVGIVGNVLLVLCVWVHKPLQQSGGYLIGVLGIFDLGANITNLVGPLTIAGGLVWQTLSYCYLLTSMQLVFGASETVMMLLTGVDRVLALSITSRYIGWNTKVYVSLMSSIAAAVGVLVSMFPLLDVIATPDMILPFCYPANLFGPRSVPLLYAYSCGVNVAVIVVYLGLHQLLKRKMSSEIAQAAGQSYLKRQKHIARSLMVILYFYLVGWVSAVVVLAVGLETGLKPATGIKIVMLAGVIAQFNFMVNFPIFLQRSKEWRNACRRLLHIDNAVSGA